ncbi:MAG: glycosyltransferase family 2 protein [Dehalococcoidia bacterium]
MGAPLPLLRPAAVAPPVPWPSRPAELGGWLSIETRQGRAFQRFLEMVPGALTWFLVTAPLWGAFFLPLPLAVGVLAFDLFWLYLSSTTAWRAWRGYRALRRDEQVDWRHLYRIAYSARRALVSWEDVRHIVIIPTYKEPPEILRRTLAGLAEQEVADQLVVILAMEDREEGAPLKSRMLEREFRDRFAAMRTTFHPAGLPGEVVGKSSNENFAARLAKCWLVDEMGHPISAITVTSCDADTVFHPRYFSCLTYKFCTDEQRYRRFWQSPILLTNNIWRSPAPLRVGSALAGVHILSNLVKKDRVMFPQSTYSLSLQLAHEVGYWDPDVIPEDWHMFLKCFFATSGKVEVEPIFLPTGNDAVHAGGWWPSIVMAYVQHKRHAWGASDIPYAIRQSLAHSEMSLRRRLRRVVALSSNHLLWSTHWFILSLGWVAPILIARLLGTEPHDTLHWVARMALTVCLIPYIVMILIDAKLRPPKPDTWTRWQSVVAFGMWFCLPVTSFITSTVPALDAQTRLMLGKRLEYRVTDKA